MGGEEYATILSAESLKTCSIANKRLDHVLYKEMLSKSNFVSHERRYLRADPLVAFKIFKGENVLSPYDFSLRPPQSGLKGTPTENCKGQAAFGEVTVRFLFTKGIIGTY